MKLMSEGIMTNHLEVIDLMNRHDKLEKTLDAVRDKLIESGIYNVPGEQARCRRESVELIDEVLPRKVYTSAKGLE
jgi:hypothetical protein